MKILRMKGMTLLELMIASSLSIIVIAMIYSLYFRVLSSMTRSYSLIETLENGRFASIFLYHQLKQSHTIGGLNSRYLCVDNIRYYIGDTHRTKNKEKVYSLYLKKGSSPAEEVVEGVSQMQIHYGLVCLNSPNICQYVEGKDVKEWSLVKAIKIRLILQSQMLSAKIWLVYVALNPRK